MCVTDQTLSCISILPVNIKFAVYIRSYIDYSYTLAVAGLPRSYTSVQPSMQGKFRESLIPTIA